MKKVILENRICFLDEDTDKVIMYIDYSTDECIWYFNSSDVITITKDMDLFNPLKNLMNNQYVFSNTEVLKSYKFDNKLLWTSDCYYDPDDEYSRNSVSFLMVKYEDDVLKLKCIKPLDEIIDRKNKSHLIVFSPMGNGKYAKNIATGSTLQDDFVIMVYQELLEKNKVRKI